MSCFVRIWIEYFLNILYIPKTALPYTYSHRNIFVVNWISISISHITYKFQLHNEIVSRLTNFLDSNNIVIVRKKIIYSYLYLLVI